MLFHTESCHIAQASINMFFSPNSRRELAQITPEYFLLHHYAQMKTKPTSPATQKNFRSKQFVTERQRNDSCMQVHLYLLYILRENIVHLFSVCLVRYQWQTRPKSAGGGGNSLGQCLDTCHHFESGWRCKM